MKKILITGATGNVGVEVIRYLYSLGTTQCVIAGVRNEVQARERFGNIPELAYTAFDFENPDTFDQALKGIDYIFLLRPPHLADVDTYFRPLISSIKRNKLSGIIFLSVQGAEKSRIIPHHKIENIIREFNIPYIFIRPSYFMQNLTTTLSYDIRTRRKIILPAGKARFNWIDVKNIGETCALLFAQFDKYSGKAIELTGSENLNFYEVAAHINASGLLPHIQYEAVNPFRFFSIKRKEGMPTGMIMVMIMLHVVPRFQQEPAISDFYRTLTGKPPTTLTQYIEQEFITGNT